MESIRKELIKEYNRLQGLEIELKNQMNLLKSEIEGPQERPPQERPPQERPPQERPPQERPLEHKDVVQKQKKVLKHLMESWSLHEINSKTNQQECSLEQNYLNYLYDDQVIVSKAFSLEFNEHMARHNEWMWMTTQERYNYINKINPKEIYVPDRGMVLDVFKNVDKKVRCCWRLAELEKVSKYGIRVHYLGWAHKYDTVLDCRSPIDRRRWVKDISLLTPYHTRDKNPQYKHNKELSEIGYSYKSMDFNQLALI
jgi:hypothetical protein